MSETLIIDQRFNKPAKDVLIDLINRQNATFFSSTQLEIDSVSTAVPVTEAFNTRANIRLNGRDDWRASMTVNYRRLNIGEFLKDLPHFIVTTRTDFADEVFHHINTFCKINLPVDDFEIESLHHDGDDGKWWIIVKPRETHPVWIGQLEIRAVEGIALLFPQTLLDGFSCPPFISEVELDGFTYPTTLGGYAGDPT